MKKTVFAILGVFILIVGLVLGWYLYNVYFVESKSVSEMVPSSTRFIDIGDGEQIAYTEMNNRAAVTVIFVGGLSAWGGTWERTVKEMNARNTNLNYVVIDLPPFGYSVSSSKKNYFRDTQAERIERFINAKGIKAVILVGHSYGGGPITEYALTNSDLVKKLVLIDAVLNIDGPEKTPVTGIITFDRLREFVIGSLIHFDPFALSRLRSFVYITDNVTPELLDVYTNYFTRDGVTSKLSAWLEDYLNDPLTYASTESEAYRSLSFPVRLIWGNEDTLTPISDTDILLETIPDVELYTLTGVGHIPMIEDYKQFDEALAGAFYK